MKGLTQKLLLSILTVVVTTIALGTTTFAWFTVTNTARIQSFSADVVGDSGIEISFDEENWYTSISAAIVDEYLFTPGYDSYQGANFLFNHVTSPNGTSFGALGGGSAPGGYLEFSLYFRSPNVEEIFLTDISLDSTERPWSPSFAFNYANGSIAQLTDSYGFRAANGARVSIEDVNSASAPFIYERPVGGPGVSVEQNVVLGGHSGVSFAEYTAGAWGPGTAGANFFNGAVSYFINSGGGLAVADAAPEGAGNVTVPNTVQTVGLGILVAELTDGGAGYFTGEIVIRVWLEGWDPDTYNNILGGDIIMMFEFKAEQNTP